MGMNALCLGNMNDRGKRMSEEDTDRRKRLMLLLSPSTYRAGAFLEAAQKLDVEIVRCLDVPEPLAEQWRVPVAADFGDAETATRSIVAYGTEHPVDAIVAVDDSATILAARAAAASWSGSSARMTPRLPERRNGLTTQGYVTWAAMWRGSSVRGKRR